MEMIRCRGLFSVPTHARTQPRTGVLAYGNDSAVSSHMIPKASTQKLM
jgi:hypothetical protein